MPNTKELDLEKAFAEEYLVKVEDIFWAMDEMNQQWFEKSDKYSDEYREHVRILIGEFRESIREHSLFDCPVGFWAYSVVLRGSGIYLYLDHYKEAPRRLMKEAILFVKDDSYEMMCMRSKLITAEEYAILHQIDHVTAVTRIRRGKIRSAIKIGSQWRIPELAEPVETGYQSTEYVWKGRLTGMPDKLKIIEDYSHAYFFQDQQDLTQYHVRFTGDKVRPMEFTCDRRHRGEIEQRLVAHPYVTCVTDVISKVETKYSE